MLSSALRSQSASGENLGYPDGFLCRGGGPQGVIKHPARSPQDLFGFSLIYLRLKFESVHNTGNITATLTKPKCGCCGYILTNM